MKTYGVAFKRTPQLRWGFIGLKMRAPEDPPNSASHTALQPEPQLHLAHNLVEALSLSLEFIPHKLDA